MAIELCKTDVESDESEFFPVCTADQYRELWQPAIAELNLPMLECLPAVEVTREFKSQFVEEVYKLKRWAMQQPASQHLEHMTTTINRILEIVEAADFDQFEISFG